MTPRAYMAAGVRLLGGDALSLAVIYLTYSIPLLFFGLVWDLDDMLLYFGWPLLTAVLGVLLLRQSQWIAAVAGRGDDPEQPLTHGALRTLVFDLVGCYAAIKALHHVALVFMTDQPAGLELTRPYLIAGYALVAVGLLFGPLRTLRAVRGLKVGPRHFSTSPLEARELEDIGRRALSAWFALAALTSAIKWVSTTPWRLEGTDLSTLASIVATAVVAWLFARAGRLPGRLRLPTTQLAFETVAVTVLVVIVPDVAAFAQGLRIGFIIQLGTPTATPITLALMIVLSFGALYWAHRLRTRGHPTLGTVFE